MEGEQQFYQGGDSRFAQDDVSPFRPPNDEEVFVTRETEK